MDPTLEAETGVAAVERPSRVLLLGVGKSGTTALMAAVAQALSLPYKMEPESLSGLDYRQSFVVKKLVDKLRGGELKYIARFDKVVFMVRDPRDTLISALLYRPYGIGAFKYNRNAKRYLGLIERKIASPSDVSTMEIAQALDEISGQATIDKLNALYDKLIRIHGTYRQRSVLLHYEDFIRKDYAALEGYLGISIPPAFRVDPKFGRVARSGAAGEWKHWFTRQDQIAFDIRFRAAYAAFGYGPESPAIEQTIDPATSLEYVRGIIDAGRARWDIPPYDPRFGGLRDSRTRLRTLRRWLARRVLKDGRSAPPADAPTLPAADAQPLQRPRPVRRKGPQDDATEARQVVFVTGVGRSGTTALVDLLNLHPQVCIGMERYKFKFLRRQEFDGREFTPARFFAFRRGDTNLVPGAAGRWRSVYEGMRDKFPHAAVVGDKIPHLFEQFEACARVFPDAKWIYMLRDVQTVASSWNARAQNPNDKWPRGNDFRPAVQVWNRGNAIARGLPADRVMIVHYEKFFGGSVAARQALLGFLGLEETPAFTAQAEASYEKYARHVKTKPSTLSEAEQAHVAAQADTKTYRALIARSRPKGWAAWSSWRPWRSAG